MEQFASLLCPNDVRAITGKGKNGRGVMFYFYPKCTGVHKRI